MTRFTMTDTIRIPACTGARTAPTTGTSLRTRTAYGFFYMDRSGGSFRSRVNVDFEPCGSSGSCHIPGGTSWSSYGSISVVFVADINPGSDGSCPYDFALLNGDLYFTANDRTHGAELWRYDPGADAAQMVADIYAGYNSSDPHYLTVLDGCFYFGADGSGGAGLGLWRHDPVGGTTDLLADTYSIGLDFSQSMTVFDGALYYSDSGMYGYELWRYDPLSRTAQVVADIYPGSDSSYPWWLTEFNGDLYFQAGDLTHGQELWRIFTTSVRK
jgi:ELWxxDGT repeat protein